MENDEITEAVARKVLEVVDAGLSKGVGKPIPGEMCVEAAVCYALGLPHGDDPKCVSRAVRALKIALNDNPWSSKAARGKGLRRLALAQLGSAGALDDPEFARRVTQLAIATCVPIALRAAASIHPKPEHKAAMLEAAVRCEIEKNSDAAAAAYAAAAYATADAHAAAAQYAASAEYATAANVRDKILSDFAEVVVQILIEMKAPGCQWLALADAA